MTLAAPRCYQTFKGFCPSWNWCFAETIAPGASLESPAINQFVSGGGVPPPFAPSPAPMADPPPQNSIFEPGRYTVTALIRTVVGTSYVYLYSQMVGSVKRALSIYVNNWTAIKELGATPVTRISQVDYWYVVILNRSAINPAVVEGAVSIYARGFL